MWICMLSGREPLQALMDACLGTGMTEEMLCLTDIATDTRRLRVPANWTLVPVMGRPALSDVARIARAARADAPYLGIVPAGYLPRSEGWDAALGAAAGHWNIAYSNDRFHCGRHPVTGLAKVTGAVALGGRLVDAMGGAIPDGMGFAEARLAWVNIGRARGCLRYLREVEVEKIIDIAGAVPEPGALGDDPARARLFRWLNDESRPLIRRLRAAWARDRRLSCADGGRRREGGGLDAPAAVGATTGAGDAACAV